MYIYEIWFYFLIKLLSLMFNEIHFISIFHKALWDLYIGSIHLSIIVATLIYSPASINTNDKSKPVIIIQQLNLTLKATTEKTNKTQS